MLTMGDTAGAGLLMLCDGDFPPHYRHGRHPEDLVPCDRPIAAEHRQHEGGFGHLRLLWRVAWRLPGGQQYLSVTFVVDTGAPLPFYLSAETRRVFHAHGLLHTDDMENDFVVAFGRRYRVVDTPLGHEPGNILGLRVILDLGLRIVEGGFEFERMRGRPAIEP